MNSLSFCAALGLTLNCSTISGQPDPMISELTISSTTPMAGMRRSRRNSAENTAAAAIRAITSRISLAGSTALMSV